MKCFYFIFSLLKNHQKIKVIRYDINMGIIMEDDNDNLFLTQFLTQAAPPRLIKPKKIDWKVGDKIASRYQIFKIREGGMGIIYFCYDNKARQPVAIKTYKDNDSLDIIEQFRSEALTWVRLGKHPNIVQARYVLDVERKPYVFMEYVDSKDDKDPTLRNYFKKGKLSVEQGLDFAIQFCNGMIHVTNIIPGLIHKDIKPENILITPDGVLKITDFGLTKVFLNMSRVLQVVGTFPYMSPEQCLGMEIIDTRADIYSFGIVLYEMLTCQRPFNGESKFALIRQHVEENPKNLSEINSTISDELNRVVMKCLSKKPENRFKNFEELKNALIELYPENKIKCYNFNNSLPELSVFEAEYLSNKGTSMITLGRYHEAMAFFDMALEMEPTYIEAHYRKAVALIGLGEYDEALENFEHYLKVDPRDAEILNHKGSLLNLQGKRDQALMCFDKALDMHPWCQEILYNKGITLFLMEEYSKSLKVFELIKEESYQGYKDMIISLCSEKTGGSTKYNGENDPSTKWDDEPTN